MWRPPAKKLLRLMVAANVGLMDMLVWGQHWANVSMLSCMPYLLCPILTVS